MHPACASHGMRIEKISQSGRLSRRKSPVQHVAARGFVDMGYCSAEKLCFVIGPDQANEVFYVGCQRCRVNMLVDCMNTAGIGAALATHEAVDAV